MLMLMSSAGVKTEAPRLVSFKSAPIDTGNILFTPIKDYTLPSWPDSNSKFSGFSPSVSDDRF